jgi:hypothetical protein
MQWSKPFTLMEYLNSYGKVYCQGTLEMDIPEVTHIPTGANKCSTKKYILVPSNERPYSKEIGNKNLIQTGRKKG